MKRCMKINRLRMVIRAIKMCHGEVVKYQDMNIVNYCCYKTSGYLNGKFHILKIEGCRNTKELNV